MDLPCFYGYRGLVVFGFFDWLFCGDGFYALIGCALGRVLKCLAFLGSCGELFLEFMIRVTAFFFQSVGIGRFLGLYWNLGYHGFLGLIGRIL